MGSNDQNKELTYPPSLTSVRSSMETSSAQPVRMTSVTSILRITLKKKWLGFWNKTLSIDTVVSLLCTVGFLRVKANFPVNMVAVWWWSLSEENFLPLNLSTPAHKAISQLVFLPPWGRLHASLSYAVWARPCFPSHATWLKGLGITHSESPCMRREVLQKWK